MSDTDKHEEGEGLPKESSDTHVSASGEEGMDAAVASGQMPAGGDGAEEEAVTAHTPETIRGGDSGEFADNVVSGLEQAALAIHRNPGTNFSSEYSDLDLEQMSEVFFSGWAGPDSPPANESSGKAPAAPIDLQAVSLTSLATSPGWEAPATPEVSEEPSRALSELAGMDLVSLSSAEGGEQPAIAEDPEVQPLSLGELSDLGLASWGASEGIQAQAEHEEPPLELEPEPEPEPEMQSLSSLGRLGLASGIEFAAFQSSSGAMNPHDELADAVQSALLSVYGEQIATPNETVFQKKAIPAEMGPSSLVWNKGSSPVSDNLSPQDAILNYFDYTPEDEDAKAPAAGDFASPASDGRTPQEVILNYFDYPSQQSGNGSLQSDYEDEEPITLRRPEPSGPLRRPRSAQERPIQRPEWPEAFTQPGQYNGPPSFPVPAAGPAGAPKSAAATPAEESSRLLGAAAIGLMGGIAIAASLAAFLIYGPHPASVEIPGFGNLRLDKDEQGYGRTVTIQDEGPKEPFKIAAKGLAEHSSEIFATDAVAVPGQPAPLTIGIRSQLPLEKTLVAIAGVPEGARLSSGIDVGGGSWLVPPKRLNGLTISLPEGAPRDIRLEAQLLDSNARTPVSPKGTFAVRLVSSPGATAPAVADAAQPQPAFAPKQPPQSGSAQAVDTQTFSLPPAAPARTANAQTPGDASFSTETVVTSPPQRAPAVPQTSPFGQQNAARRACPRPEVEDLIREGNKHMREGDILEARQFYQKAVNFGDPEAALAMGRSYDPIYFARIEKKNAEPDAAKAFDWYKRAMDAGASQTAMVRIENLKHFLNE